MEDWFKNQQEKINRIEKAWETEGLSAQEDLDKILKSWSTDLQKKNPGSSWKTINGAKILVGKGGEVLASNKELKEKLEGGGKSGGTSKKIGVLEKKLEKLRELTTKLSKEGLDPLTNTPSDKYYTALSDFQETRKKLNLLYNKRQQDRENSEEYKKDQELAQQKIDREEKRRQRENEVTSTTHEKWLKRNERAIDKKFEDRGKGVVFNKEQQSTKNEGKKDLKEKLEGGGTFKEIDIKGKETTKGGMLYGGVVKYEGKEVQILYTYDNKEDAESKAKEIYSQLKSGDYKGKRMTVQTQKDSLRQQAQSSKDEGKKEIKRDLTENEKALLDRAKLHLGEKGISEKSVMAFADAIDKKEGKKELSHFAEAIQYAQAEKDLKNLFDSGGHDALRAIRDKGASTSHPQAGRILELKLPSPELNKVAKERNDLFMNIQNKTKNLDNDARKLLEVSIEKLGLSIEKVNKMVNALPGKKAEDVANVVSGIGMASEGGSISKKEKSISKQSDKEFLEGDWKWGGTRKDLVNRWTEEALKEVGKGKKFETKEAAKKEVARMAKNTKGIDDERYRVLKLVSENIK